jgi:hypothetical protein
MKYTIPMGQREVEVTARYYLMHRLGWNGRSMSKLLEAFKYACDSYTILNNVDGGQFVRIEVLDNDWDVAYLVGIYWDHHDGEILETEHYGAQLWRCVYECLAKWLQQNPGV